MMLPSDINTFAALVRNELEGMGPVELSLNEQLGRLDITVSYFTPAKTYYTMQAVSFEAILSESGGLSSVVASHMKSSLCQQIEQDDQTKSATQLREEIAVLRRRLLGIGPH